MRAGNANRRLGVSAIFHSKALYNDGPLSASSRLVTPRMRSPLLKFTSDAFHRCKSFVAQIPATSKFPSIQRNDGRGPDEIRPINFELNVAPHASGSVLDSMGRTSDDLRRHVAKDLTKLYTVEQRAMTFAINRESSNGSIFPRITSVVSSLRMFPEDSRRTFTVFRDTSGWWPINPEVIFC